MKNCYTTQAFADIYAKLTEDELRSGKLEHETRCICNESGTTQVNLTIDEIDDYHMVYDASDEVIDSDIINNETLDRLVHFLTHTDRLEGEPLAKDRLAAAAPEMLAALNCALADLQGSLEAHENYKHPHDWDAHRLSIEECKAAIAKATNP
jgi:hypothetical protein